MNPVTAPSSGSQTTWEEALSPPASHRGEPAWEIALLFPPQGSWTEAEYLALDTKRLIELSNGCLEVLPMPTVLHQRIVMYLYRILHGFVLGRIPGEVLTSPLPIRLWPGTLREPDVLLLKPGRVTDPRQPPNGADLAIEVVSPGAENRKRDLEIKRAEYAAASIQEYWIVDPEMNAITVLVLEGGAYREHGVFGAGAVATSELLTGLSVEVNQVFAAAEAV